MIGGIKETLVYNLIDSQYKVKNSSKCKSVEKVVEALRNGGYHKAAGELRKWQQCRA